ncbi:MAG: PD-(D/E)XK nuclease family protein, partial [Patescibacteria group bacterium]
THAQDYFGKQRKKPSRFLYELGLVGPETAAKKESSVKSGDWQEQKIRTVDRKKVSYVLPDSFSFSSISSYLKCPLEYKYRYLLKIPAPSNAYLSFGSSMHKALESFMKLWKARLSSQQLGLFGSGEKSKSKVQFPSLKELEHIYEEKWIDDWYSSKSEREQFKKRGLEQLKTFYEVSEKESPKPKYLEQFFKLKLGNYKFVGKIDRIDEGSGGVTILDYKTGENPPKSLGKVDFDQLLIYQIAAEEFLQEKVIQSAYWYLNKNVMTEPFLGGFEEIEKLKTRYLEVIKDIIESVKTDNFASIHKDGGHDCQYKSLI